MRRILLDTEWTAPPWSDRSELMWIGLADDEGRSWYGISSEVEIDPSANDSVSGAFRLISPDEPRMSRAWLAASLRTTFIRASTPSGIGAFSNASARRAACEGVCTFGRTDGGSAK